LSQIIHKTICALCPSVIFAAFVHIFTIKVGAARKGKTAIEIYGEEKAKAMIEKRIATMAEKRRCG